MQETAAIQEFLFIIFALYFRKCLLVGEIQNSEKSLFSYLFTTETPHDVAEQWDFNCSYGYVVTIIPPMEARESQGNQSGLGLFCDDKFTPMYHFLLSKLNSS